MRMKMQDIGSAFEIKRLATLKNSCVCVYIYIYIQRERDAYTHTHTDIVIVKPYGNQKPKINNRYTHTKVKAVQTQQ